MADYLIQESTLDAIVRAINDKAGTQVTMTPAQMVTAIGNISGGGGETLLASGQYVVASADAAQINIPISISGTPTMWVVVVAEPTSNTTQAYSWGEAVNMPTEMANAIPTGLYEQLAQMSNGTFNKTEANYVRPVFSNTQITVYRFNATYPILPGTYNWYVWGYAS